MNDDFLIKPTKKSEEKPPTEPIEEHHPKEISQPATEEPPAVIVGGKSPEKPKRPKTKRRSPKQWFLSLSKKKRILTVIAIVVVMTGIISGIVFALKLDKPATKKAVQKTAVVEKPKPTTEAGRLTGVQISPELNKRAVTAIMIENSPDARPQSGLKDAGVVFEAIAEGGITRFLTLHQEDQPDYIGPVRSVRPYFIDWAEAFDAPIAHAGGSADGLAKLKSEGIKDLDQFANSAAYQRINTRYAPHNLYTSSAKLDALEAAKGYTSSSFEGFPRKAEKPAATPTAKTIDFGISGVLYNPHYDYDTATNSYKRSEGGVPHVDERSGIQISPKVVIANIMNYAIAANGVNSTYNSIGSGKSFIFQDGTVTVGTWEKTSGKSQMTFKDASGATIKLNPGQTWISAVGAESGVVYKP